MKKIYIVSSLLLTTLVFSQIGINTVNPKSILDISVERNQTGVIQNNNKPFGLQAPRLTLGELSSLTAVYGENHVGTFIYITDVSSGTASGQRINIVDEGYYYFDGSVWRNMVLSVNSIVSLTSIVDPNILGYTPSTTANAGAAAAPVITGTTVTKLGNITYPGNRHSYASYMAARTITWYEAYNAAKSLGGYLATFTTDAEWQYVETNLINTETQFNTYPGWIGFAKYSWFAGSSLTPNPEMKWITGEQPLHDYSAGGTSAVRKSNWFDGGEPNNGNSNEGFVHFLRGGSTTKVYNGYTSRHPWNDVSANNTSYSIRGFIVEFQQ